MTDLIEVIRTARKVGTGDSMEGIVHEHAQFYTPDGELLAESCTLDEECMYTKDGNPWAVVDGGKR